MTSADLSAKLSALCSTQLPEGIHAETGQILGYATECLARGHTVTGENTALFPFRLFLNALHAVVGKGK
ncbi:hypothetical protein SARC_11637, partial [Sphaeroforma arctica JP610]